jgi:hypothetical protein
MKLLVMQLSPPSCHSTPLWPKYSPQYPVLKHPQFMGYNKEGPNKYEYKRRMEYY